MKKLISPMVAIDYRETINNNFTFIEEILQHNENLVDLRKEAIQKSIDASILELNQKIANDSTYNRREFTKLYSAIDVLYKMNYDMRGEIYELREEIAEMKKPLPKKWYSFLKFW